MESKAQTRRTLFAPLLASQHDLIRQVLAHGGEDGLVQDH